MGDPPGDLPRAFMHGASSMATAQPWRFADIFSTSLELGAPCLALRHGFTMSLAQRVVRRQNRRALHFVTFPCYRRLHPDTSHRGLVRSRIDSFVCLAVLLHCRTTDRRLRTKKTEITGKVDVIMAM